MALLAGSGLRHSLRAGLFESLPAHSVPNFLDGADLGAEAFADQRVAEILAPLISKRGSVDMLGILPQILPRMRKGSRGLPSSL